LHRFITRAAPPQSEALQSTDFSGKFLSVISDAWRQPIVTNMPHIPKSTVSRHNSGRNLLCSIPPDRFFGAHEANHPMLLFGVAIGRTASEIGSGCRQCAA